MDDFSESTHWADEVSKLQCPSVVYLCVCVCHGGNPASWWAGDFWSKRVSLILV